MTKLRNYHWYRFPELSQLYKTQLFGKLFLTQPTRFRVWNIINLIEKCHHIICKTNLLHYLLSTHICVYSFCRFSDTSIIMTSQRRCHARDSQNHAYIFYTARVVAAHFGNSLPDFGIVMYQNELIHVIIEFKHDVPCIVRSEALRGHSDTSAHSALCASSTDWSSWRPRASDHTMHGILYLYGHGRMWTASIQARRLIIITTTAQFKNKIISQSCVVFVMYDKNHFELNWIEIELYVQPPAHMAIVHGSHTW